MRIVVLGAGYAGVTLARRLESRLPPDVELVVVDEHPVHLVQHEVHRVIRAPDVADAIEVPLSEIFGRARVVTGRVERVDREHRRVHLTDVHRDPREGDDVGDDAAGDHAAEDAAGDHVGDDTADLVVDGELAYDYAAICLGADTAYYDLPGVEAHGLPLKSVDDALTIREAFLEACADAATTGESPTAVVGGAGLSGVQVAGELAALADEEGVDVDVALLEMAESVAPTFPESFQRAVETELLEQGVDVRTGVTVEGATKSTVETDDGDLDYDVFVWTGGITGTDALDGDRPVVRRDLRLDAHTFAVGDAARVIDVDGEAVPASASAALREARVVADNLVKLVRHDREADPDDFEPRLDPYRFSVPGWIVSVGEGTVAQVGPSVVRGAAARAMKATVGAGHLSSVGAVRRAVSLVDAELGRSVDVASGELPEAVPTPDGVEVPDPADVHDGGLAVDGPDDHVDEGPIEIEIDVTDPEATDSEVIDPEASSDTSTTDDGEAERRDDPEAERRDDPEAERRDDPEAERRDDPEAERREDAGDE